MKARLIHFVSVLTAVVLLLSAFGLPVTAAPAEEKTPQHYTEITVSAAEIQSKGAFKAIQIALNSAHFSATKDNIYKIIVAPGKYDLRSALHVYSNTTLSLNNVTLVRNKESITNMIRTGDDTAVNKGATGYSPNSNITIEGGTLDGGNTSNTMVKVTHASSFGMVGTTLCNVKNAHIMEVAAVDGLNVQNCSFKNQVLDADDVGYEAIQLDIPKDGHIIGCRSEALNIKNVRVESCYFTNCPRAVGSHTQILNLPLDGISIVNNTFKDMKSAAIQGENWKNVRITGNTIEKTPRAIALYSFLSSAEGGFKASVLAKEGGTKTSVPDTFQTPYKANIVISDNVIKNCGTVKDIYADYEPQAIVVKGQTLTKALAQNKDGSAGYPKGNYYVNGVTVKNNTINTAGNGVYLENVRNATVNSNKITCTANKLTGKIVNPITSLTVTFVSINGNNIESAPNHGMELADSAITNIKSNSITNVSLDGILLEAKSKVTQTISDNYITKASRYGVNIRPECAAGKVTGNIIYGCGKGNIQKEKTATATIGKNYYKIAQMTSLSLNQTSINLGEDEKYTLVPSYAPVNSVAKFTWSSSDPAIAGVSDKGVVTAYSFGKADITVKSANGKTAVCHVNVLPAPQNISLNATMLTIGEGETYDLDASLPSGTVSHSIEYTSNNPSAVSVQKTGGLLKGVGIGTATVAAKTFNGLHAGCNVIVKAAPYDIWFDSGEISLGTGEISTLRVHLPDGSASHSMVYNCDNKDVLSVEQNGQIIAKSVGTATVTATAFNGAKAICTVTVKNEPTTVKFYQQEYTAYVGESQQLDVVFNDNEASRALSFQSSDPEICRVNRTTGEITPKKAGTVTVTAKTFNRVVTTCTVTVKEYE